MYPIRDLPPVREEVEQRAGAHLDPLGARVLELEVLPLLEHAERALEPDRGPEQFAVGPSPAEHIPAALDAQGRAQTFIQLHARAPPEQKRRRQIDRLLSTAGSLGCSSAPLPPFNFFNSTLLFFAKKN